MPISSGMGYGPETPEKLKFFEGFMAMHAAMCKSICLRHNRAYVYMDINAGPGIDEELGHIGSPILALNALSECFPYIDALLVDKEQIHVDKLILATEPWGEQVDVRRGDHDIVLPEYVSGMPDADAPQGLLFHDPTGVPNFHLLQKVFTAPAMKRIDVLIYMSAAGYKRKQHAAEKNKNMPLLLDELSGVSKTKWLVSRPRSKHQWAFLLGTNWGGFPDWKRRGFLSVNDTRGQDILEKLNLTASEWGGLHQPQLF